jgi:hypothetical protein
MGFRAMFTPFDEFDPRIPDQILKNIDQFERLRIHENMMYFLSNFRGSRSFRLCQDNPGDKLRYLYSYERDLLQVWNALDHNHRLDRSLTKKLNFVENNHLDEDTYLAFQNQFTDLEYIEDAAWGIYDHRYRFLLKMKKSQYLRVRICVLFAKFLVEHKLELSHIHTIDLWESPSEHRSFLNHFQLQSLQYFKKVSIDWLSDARKDAKHKFCGLECQELTLSVDLFCCSDFDFDQLPNLKQIELV